MGIDPYWLSAPSSRAPRAHPLYVKMERIHKFRPATRFHYASVVVTSSPPGRAQRSQQQGPTRIPPGVGNQRRGCWR